jgi:hypothetical protein
MTRQFAKITISLAILAFSLNGTAFGASGPVSEQEAYEIGKEAYVYFYPLVMMDVTRKVMTNVEPGKRIGAGPANEFSHARDFPPADFRDVVRPNFDTLYSIAWLDLTKEPVVMSAPDTKGRYYLLPLLDMWTDVFAAPGKRTSGTGAAQFAVVPPNWKGRLPRGVEKIEAPTPYVWVLGRTQTNGPKDYDAVHEIQDGYKLTPLSRLGKPARPAATGVDPSVDMKTPLPDQVSAMPAGKFFAYAAELLKINPPHVTDWSQIARFKRIGIEPGKSFDLEKADPAVKGALEKASVDSFANMKAKIPTLARVANGWQMNTDTMGVYGDYYLKRAIVSVVGLGANQPEDAIYPFSLLDNEHKPLDGAKKYLLHFTKSELPPVAAFWSITLYDDKGFQVANPLNRFAIGDRDALRYSADGSLDLYIQNSSPGPDKETNWLPSPAAGGENITMRLYAPKAEALDGRWVPPTIKHVE